MSGKKTHRRTFSGTSRISTALTDAVDGPGGVGGAISRGFRSKFPYCCPSYDFKCPLCCPKFRLPSWRFSSTFEWRSRTAFEGRLIPVAAGAGADRDAIREAQKPNPETTETEFGSNETRTSKYSAITFVPLNLFEQFRRGANLYFLSTLALTLILPDSPISPGSWLMSLVFVVLVTMAKQGYEDYLRHKADK